MFRVSRPAEYIDAAEVKRILVIRLGGIGDIVLITPALRLLKTRFREAKIDVLVKQGFDEAISGLQYVDRVIELDKRFDLGLLCRLITTTRLLQSLHYDLIVNLQPGLKTCGVSYMAASRFAVTFRKDRSRQPDTGRVRHAIDDFVHALAPLGISGSQDRSLEFYVPDQARKVVYDLLRSRGALKQGALIVINPTATRRVNRWPPNKWAALIDRFVRRPSCRVCIVGGLRELSTVAAVLQLVRNRSAVVDLSSRLSLKDMGALLESSAVLVTGDTGPMHIASAVGTPIVCLSGAADPDRSGPLTPNSRILIDKSLSCVSCGRKTCRYGYSPKCMSLISVDEVALAVSERLETSRHNDQGVPARCGTAGVGAV